MLLYKNTWKNGWKTAKISKQGSNDSWNCQKNMQFKHQSSELFVFFSRLYHQNRKIIESSWMRFVIRQNTPLQCNLKENEMLKEAGYKIWKSVNPDFSGFRVFHFGKNQFRICKPRLHGSGYCSLSNIGTIHHLPSMLWTQLLSRLCVCVKLQKIRIFAGKPIEWMY